MAKSKNAPSIGLIIFAVVAAVLVFVCAAVGVSLANRTFLPETAPADAMTDFLNVVDSSKLENDEYYKELREMTDLQNLVAAWATDNNDARMQLSSVETFLIVIKEAGTVDTNYGNADIISLVSVNSEAKKVSVITLDDDIFVHIDLAGTGLNASSPVYAKLNAAYANGGIALLEKTIENNFKIEVDHYIVTDMSGIKTVTDALGGLSVMLDEEIKQTITDDFNIILPADNTPLNGQQMVSFLREKKDGTDNRTDRVTDSLTSAIKAAQKLGIKDAFAFIKTLASVIRTDLSGKALITVLRSTLLGGWDNFQVVGFSMPNAENMLQYKDSAWMRVIDIPVEAQQLQEKLFNKSNITLNENRLSALDLIGAVNKIYADELAKQQALAEQEANAENAENGENGEETENENENDPGTVG